MCNVPPSKPTATLPAITPTKISIKATEMPVRIEIRLATRARPIQTAAINQMFSNIKNSFRLEGVISSRDSPRFRRDGKLHCLAGLYRIAISDQPKDSGSTSVQICALLKPLLTRTCKNQRRESAKNGLFLQLHSVFLSDTARRQIVGMNQRNDARPVHIGRRVVTQGSSRFGLKSFVPLVAMQQVDDVHLFCSLGLLENNPVV